MKKINLTGLNPEQLQKISEIVAIGATVEEKIGIVEKAMPWAAGYDDFCLDCPDNMFNLNAFRNAVREHCFDYDSLNRLENQCQKEIYEKFCRLYGAEEERLKKVADAIVAIGLDAKEVDEIAAERKAVDGKYGTRLKENPPEFGGCIRKDVFLNLIRELLMRKL